MTRFGYKVFSLNLSSGGKCSDVLIVVEGATLGEPRDSVEGFIGIDGESVRDGAIRASVAEVGGLPGTGV